MDITPIIDFLSYLFVVFSIIFLPFLLAGLFAYLSRRRMIGASTPITFYDIDEIQETIDPNLGDFCPNCGSPLFVHEEETPRHNPLTGEYAPEYDYEVLCPTCPPHEYETARCLKRKTLTQPLSKQKRKTHEEELVDDEDIADLAVLIAANEDDDIRRLAE